MNLREILIKGFNSLEIEADDSVLDKFETYKKLLVEWNEKMNLTAILDDEGVAIKHFLDSISCLEEIGYSEVKSIIDIGTGAGFPGIPMKIMNNQLEVTLLDSLKKRTIFLEEVSDKLGFDDIHVIHGRAEDFAKEESYRESYDYAVSRAVARLNILCEYCLPFVKVGGYFVSQKGKECYDEVEE